jgi:hypothetical protein
LRVFALRPAKGHPFVATLQEPRTNTVEQLYSILKQSPDPIWMLGAGASRMSGVPLCDGLVALAAKWEYCKETLRSFDDPRVKPSDFLGWLKEKPWYRSGSLADNYQAVVRHLLQPRNNRRDFFLKALDTRVPASSGYQRMAEFMFRRIVRTILTTNFDTVLPDYCRTNRRPHNLQVIQTPSDYMNLRTDPRDAQYVLLHGSVEHYSDRNDSDEIQALDRSLVDRVLPLLRDHPLIVVGYRGAEPSIMQHLLVAQAAQIEFFRMGVYWCAVEYSGAESLHPLVRSFADTIGTNFQVVPIEGFDELMERLWALREAADRDFAGPTASAGSESPTATFDLRVQEHATISDLDLTVARSRLLTYCSTFDMSVPQRLTDDGVRDLLVRFDLAVQTSTGQVLPTHAGFLLFGKKPQQLLPHAVVHLDVNGETRVISGNLWNQLDAISDALTEFNRPFRLKGEISEPVYPYPPLALKETVVNALVHRDYTSDAPIVIHILPDRIEISNPGGLVPEILSQTGGTSLQERIAQGQRGIKGYRNPAIADLFYSAGAMDKKGSGLADVHQWVAQGGGSLKFSTSPDNSLFEIAITSRPEAVDRITGTAVPLVPATRYAANLLEVLEVPTHIWKAATKASSVKSIWRDSRGRWLPPFVFQASAVHAFQEFRLSSGQKARPVSVADFRRDGGEQLFVWLLNEHFYRHLKARGLAVDKKRKRAYFPRTEAGERPVPYQARLRRATRVVTKPIVSRTTQKIRYWEHKAFYFSFECLADTWVLQILPGYVFTTDGKYDLLNSARVTALATRRASRDYNNHVHNDLVFWNWVLSSGEAGTYTLDARDGYADPLQLAEEKDTQGGRRRRNRSGTDTILARVDDAAPIVLSSTLPTSLVSAAPEPEPDVAMAEPESDEFPEIEEELTRIIESTAMESERAS